jgi:hypothetical protein
MLKKPKFVIRRAAKSTAEERTVDPEPTTRETDEAAPSEPLTPVGNQASDAIPADEQDHPTQSDPSTDAGPHPPAPPPVPGFTLEGASTGHQYAIRSLVTLCDCCVQKSPDGIFDVLGRNFVDTGGLMWWLRKVGKPHVAEQIKGKDVVDAVRKAAHLLFPELKAEIGRPVARW